VRDPGQPRLEREQRGGRDETVPLLDGTTLYFGSTRTGGGAEGDSDHYVTTREKLTGSDG
jgi:hypothetical protein